MIKAVIFDLDNTLVDFMKFKKQSVEAAVDAMIDAGLKIDKKKAEEIIYEIYEEKGIEYQRIFDEFLEKVLGKIDYKILSAGIVAYRRVKEATLSIYPHVRQTLTELLKMNLKLGVVSDAPRLQAWTRIAQAGLLHYFDVVVTFDDTKVLKPAAEPFMFALNKLGLEPKEAIMVGDWAERDIVGAKQIGMITVFARYGDVFGTQNSGADYEINDIYELVDIIKNLNKKDG